jgi:PAS domain S-box-containing protein
MSGFEVCQKLKADEDLKDIPVIFITAFADIKYRVKGLQLGAIDYIIKPIEITELTTRISTHLKIHSLQRALIQANEHLEEKIKLRTYELMKSEERFQKLSDLTVEGLAIHKNGVIMDINNSFIRMFGYSREELIGKNIISLFVEFTSTKIIEQKIREKQTSSYEVELRTKNNELIPVEIEAKEVVYNHEEIRVTAFRDLREKKDIEHKILKTIIETEEKERARFAMELHDGLGPILSSIKMYVNWMKKPGIKTNLDEINTETEKLIDEAHRSLHEIAFNISPHLLQNFGLNEALQSYIHGVAKRSNINVILNNNQLFKLNSTIETILYRCITESVSNTLKHANATEIKIELNEINGNIEVTYSDNGIGFEVDKALNTKKGLGLFNLKSRISSLGGNLDIISGIGIGTKIVIKIKK